MNKAQLAKSVGFHVRLRPIAAEPTLREIDDDWEITKVENDTLEMRNVRSSHTAVMGVDAVVSLTRDPARDTQQRKYGFLQITVRVILQRNGRADIEPLPFARGGDSATPQMEPLVVRDAETDRFFS